MIEESSRDASDDPENTGDDSAYVEADQRELAGPRQMEPVEFDLQAPPYLVSGHFDALVSEVMDELPAEWAPILDNMTVVVEDEPAAEDLDDEPANGHVPLGRYRGVGGPVRLLAGGLAGPAVTAPPEIALFQGPLERASTNVGELREYVRTTLVREIGRHFGLAGDDEELDDEASYEEAEE